MDEINKKEGVGEHADLSARKNNAEAGVQFVIQGTAANIFEATENFDMKHILASQKFINSIRLFDEKIRSEVIGKALEYLVVNPDGCGFWEFMQTLVDTCSNASERELEEEVRKLCVQSILHKLKMEDGGSISSKIKFIDHCVEHLIKNGVYFHGFNGVFEKNILENGLTTDERQWNWDELRKIQGIGKKAGNPTILGWSFLNCEGQISLSENAQLTYDYATVSPEWFAQLVCEGSHVPVEGQRKTAFHRRNYKDARDNVSLLCDQLMSHNQEDIEARRAYPNITADDRNEIMLFFEKYWEKLAGPESKPKVAIIKSESLFENAADFEEYIQQTRESLMKLAPERTLSQVMGLFFLKLRSDIQIKKAVPKEKLTIVDLPEYAAIFRN